MEVTVTMTNRTKKESVQISWLGKDKNQKKLDLLPILFIIYLMTTISHFRAYSVQTVPKLEFVFHKTSNLITASYLFCFLLHSTLPSLIFQIMNFEKGFHCWFFQFSCVIPTLLKINWFLSYFCVFCISKNSHVLSTILMRCLQLEDVAVPMKRSAPRILMEKNEIEISSWNPHFRFHSARAMNVQIPQFCGFKIFRAALPTIVIIIIIVILIVFRCASISWIYIVHSLTH